MRKIIAVIAALVAVLAVAGSSSAEPTDEFGAAGAALMLEENVNNPEPIVVQTEADGAEITTQPVETLPDGTAKYMSQDGGDGEHASVAVNQAMRNAVMLGEFRTWGLDFGETDQSTDTATVFWVQAGETRFLLTLEREQ